MARQRDSAKREAVLAASKSLFARKGYHATSISDIRRETGLSTGTIYNYFASKEEIVSTIVEEGWQELVAELTPSLGSRPELVDRADFLAFTLLPKLLKDEDLIHILLSEAVEISRISDKLKAVVAMVLRLREDGGDAGGIDEPTMVRLQTAITVYFLGFLETVRISRRTDLGIGQKDILRFIRDTIIRDLNSLSGPGSMAESTGGRSG